MFNGFQQILAPWFSFQVNSVDDRILTDYPPGLISRIAPSLSPIGNDKYCLTTISSDNLSKIKDKTLKSFYTNLMKKVQKFIFSHKTQKQKPIFFIFQ